MVNRIDDAAEHLLRCLDHLRSLVVEVRSMSPGLKRATTAGYLGDVADQLWSEHIDRLLRLIDEEDAMLPEEREGAGKPGLLVEDATVVGGKDVKTGAPVVRPKTVDGRADESTIPTDPREASRQRGKD